MNAKKQTVVAILLTLLFSCVSYLSLAQKVQFSGKIIDQDGLPVEGAHIYLEDKKSGVISKKGGVFSFEAEVALPQTLVVSMIGFEVYKMPIVSVQNVDLNIKLKETILFGQEVIVSASRVEEDLLSSSSTVEKLTVAQIQDMPSINFYDGLTALKGVDVNAQSITMKNVNTRGFNGTTNYRFNQIIDGVMNTAPGLSFAAGNMLGISPLDVESVELLTGASSALYGAGGMNGTLIVNSKNPYDYQGFSASFQMAAMNVNQKDINTTPYYEFNARYAKAFNDKFAFKAVVSYLTAEDWHANDYRDKTNLDDPSSDRYSNPGYDGVNVFGDEFALNLESIEESVADGFAQAQGFSPGTPEYDDAFQRIVDVVPDQYVSRTGWNERDIVDYNASNLKASLNLFYKFGDNWQANLEGAYASGQAVYSAQNRFSINDFEMGRYKAEIKKDDHFFLRYWFIYEDGGLTYDAGGTAAFINESWKDSGKWYEDYIAGFLQSVLLGNSEEEAHRFGRLLADNRDEKGNIFNPEEPARPLAGTEEYKQLLDQIIRTPINQGGARVLDFSKMGQLEGMYNFNTLFKDDIDLVMGFQYRHYIIDSDGTVFADDVDSPIRQYEWGVYAQYIDRFIDERLKLNISARYDKNEYFKGEVTPRISLVYQFGPHQKQNIRASAQSAFRFPSVSDQWLDLDIGGVQNLGGQSVLLDQYGISDSPVYPLIGTNPVLAVPDTSNGPLVIPPFEAEKMYSLEVGYKSLILDQKMMIDANAYFTEYNGFHVSQSLVKNPYEENEERFIIFKSNNAPVNTWGWSLGMDYQFYHTFFLGGNVSYNVMDSDVIRRNEEEGLQGRYNTPDYRFNIYTGNRYLTPHIGFQVNYKWQNSFLWESAFGVGEIPAFGSLDAQVTYRMDNLNSKIKLGASNILNQYYTTSLGSAQIGGMYYFTLSYEPRRRS